MLILGSAKQLVELDVLLSPRAHDTKEFLQFSSDDPSIQDRLNRLSSNKKNLQALKTGIKEGLKYGPKLHCPVSEINPPFQKQKRIRILVTCSVHFFQLMETTVIVSDIIIGKGTSPTMLTSAATQSIRKVCLQFLIFKMFS